MTSTVQLLGDSTLDNIKWLFNPSVDNEAEAKKSCVEGQLRTKLGTRYKVVNHAYDGFTTKDVSGPVTKGIGDIFLGSNEVNNLPLREDLYRTWPQYRAYLKDKGRVPNNVKVRPLDELIKSLPNQGHHYVVISVGGNDFRENLAHPLRLIRDISNVQQRYLRIVNYVKSLSSGKREVYPILMFQYRTDANQDPYRIYTLLGWVGVVAFSINVICVALITTPLVQFSLGIPTSIASKALYSAAGLTGLYLSHKIVPLSVSKDILQLKKPSISLFGALLKRLYQPMLQEARESRIPILDLPNTFNPYRHLYISGIEPNAEGAELIAEGIAHIVQNHDFDGESQLYAAENHNYVGSPNTKAWSVAYPQPPQSKT